MSDATSVVKLFNFFVKFRDSCKGKNHNHRLIDILQETFVCESEDDVLLLYPSLLNQIEYAFSYLEKFSHQDKEELQNLKDALRKSINLGRQELYITVSLKNQNPASYQIYLDDVTFRLLRSISAHYKDEESNLSEQDISDLVSMIESLTSDIEAKDIGYGEKLYLKNLLKRITLIIKNYDKLSFDDDLSGDIVSLFYNITADDSLKNDSNLCQKAKQLFSKLCDKMKPKKLMMVVKAKILPIPLLEVEVKGEW